MLTSLQCCKELIPNATEFHRARPMGEGVRLVEEQGMVHV